MRQYCGGDGDPALIANLTGGVPWARLTAQERVRKEGWAPASYAERCPAGQVPSRVSQDLQPLLPTRNVECWSLTFRSDAEVDLLHAPDPAAFLQEDTAAADLAEGLVAAATDVEGGGDAGQAEGADIGFLQAA